MISKPLNKFSSGHPSLSFVVLFLFFLSPSLSASDGKVIVERMIHKMRGHVNVAQYEMTVERPSWTRTLRLKAWDDRARGRVFIRILEPPKDAGTCFLRIGYNLWSWLPKVEKEMKIPPSMMLQPWMGSDFTNDDLVKESSYIDDYTHQIAGEEVREGRRVRKIELTPKPNAPVVWGKVIFWVWMGEDLPLEQHFEDEKGTLIKDLDFSDFRRMDGILLPTLWEMKTVTKPGQRTTLRLLSIDFDPVPPLPEWVFSKQHFTRTSPHPPP